MLRLLIEKELKEIIGSTKFSLTFGACAVLILLTFYVGARNYQVGRAQYEAAVAENYRQMEGLTDWLRVDNHRIFLPPQPLATLVSGVSNDIGRTILVQGRGELSATDSRYGNDPLFAVFRFLDLEFIFTVVISLFAILFAYDAVNGEKERGTLRLALSNAVPRDRFILSKIIGSFPALAVPLLIPILIGCLLLPLLGIPMTSDSWIRLVLVILAGFLYMGIFLTLSVFMSTLTRKSSHSFLLLLMGWILFVLIIPRSSVLLAGRAIEVPGVDALMTEKSHFRRQLWEEDMDHMGDFKPTATGQDMFQEFQKFMSEMADERDEKQRLFNERLNEDRRNRQMIQQRWSFALSRMSPAAAFSLAATNLAGTALQMQEHFLNAAELYQDKFAEFMVEKTGRNLGGGFRMIVSRAGEEEPDPIDPYELPAFEYVPQDLNDVLPSALVDLGLLVMFNFLFFVGAFVAFLRYDVR